MQLETLIVDVEPRLRQIEREMSLPEVLTNPNRLKELAREHRRLS